MKCPAKAWIVPDDDSDSRSFRVEGADQYHCCQNILHQGPHYDLEYMVEFVAS